MINHHLIHFQWVMSIYMHINPFRCLIWMHQSPYHLHCLFCIRRKAIKFTSWIFKCLRSTGLHLQSHDQNSSFLEAARICIVNRLKYPSHLDFPSGSSWRAPVSRASRVRCLWNNDQIRNRTWPAQVTIGEKHQNMWCKSPLGAVRD